MLGVVTVVIAEHHMDAIPAAGDEESFELFGVPSTTEVAVVPVIEALIGGVREHPIDLALEPLRFEVDGALEGLGLEPPAHLVTPC